MIKMKFYRKPERGQLCVTMTGHSGAGNPGTDILCSAATMLCYAAAQALMFYHQDGKLKRPPKIQIRYGKATIIATPTEEGYAQVLNSLWTLQCGAHVLVKNYPDRFDLECFRIEDQAS